MPSPNFAINDITHAIAPDLEQVVQPIVKSTTPYLGEVIGEKAAVPNLAALSNPDMPILGTQMRPDGTTHIVAGHVYSDSPDAVVLHPRQMGPGSSLDTDGGNLQAMWSDLAARGVDPKLGFYRVQGNFLHGYGQEGEAVELQDQNAVPPAFGQYMSYLKNAQDWMSSSPFIQGLVRRTADQRSLTLMDAAAREDPAATETVANMQEMSTGIMAALKGEAPGGKDLRGMLYDWQHESVRNEMLYTHIAQAAQRDGYDGIVAQLGHVTVFPNEPVDMTNEIARVKRVKWTPFAFTGIAGAAVLPFTTEAQAAEKQGKTLESSLQELPSYRDATPEVQAEVRTNLGDKYYNDTAPPVSESDLLGREDFRKLPPDQQDVVRKGLGDRYVYDAPLDAESRPSWFSSFSKSFVGESLAGVADVAALGASIEGTEHPFGKHYDTWFGPGSQVAEIGQQLKDFFHGTQSPPTPTRSEPISEPSNSDTRSVMHILDFSVNENMGWGDLLKEVNQRAGEVDQMSQAMGAPPSALVLGKVAGALAPYALSYAGAAEALPMASYRELRDGLSVFRATVGYMGRQAVLGAASQAPFSAVNAAAGTESPGAAAADVAFAGVFQGGLAVGAEGGKLLGDVGRVLFSKTAQDVDALTMSLEQAGGYQGINAAWKKWQAQEALPKSVADFVDSLNGRLQRGWWRNQLDLDVPFRRTDMGRYIDQSLNAPEMSHPVPADLSWGEWTRRWFESPKRWAAELQTTNPGIPLYDHIVAVDQGLLKAKQYAHEVGPEWDGLMKRLDDATGPAVAGQPSARELALRVVLESNPAKRQAAATGLEAAAPGAKRTELQIKPFERPTKLPPSGVSPLGGPHPVAEGAVDPRVALAKRMEMQTVPWTRDAMDWIKKTAGSYRLPQSFLRRKGAGVQAQLTSQEVDQYFRTWLPILSRVPKHVVDHLDEALKQNAISRNDYLLLKNFTDGKLPRLRAFHNSLINAGLNPATMDDVGALGRSVLRASADSRFVKPSIDRMRREFIDPTPGGLARNLNKEWKYPLPVRMSAERYLNGVQHVPGEYAKEMQGWFRRIYKGMGIEASDQRVTDLADMYITAHYGSLMAFRPGVALRQFLQIPTTIYPLLGGKWIAEGTKRLVSKGGLAKLKEAGVTIEDFLPYLGEAMGAAREHAVMPGWRGTLIGKPVLTMEKGMTKMTEIGLRATHYADTAVRGITYFGQRARAEDAHAQLLSAMQEASLTPGKDMPTRRMVDQYFSNSGLRYLDPQEQKNALTTMFRTPQSVLDQADSVAHRTAFTLQEDTNWIYRAGHRPPIISEDSPLGVFAKAIGQFGVWTSNYLFYMRGLSRLAMRDPAAGSAAIGRWAVGNTAAKVAAAGMGVNLSNWLFFSPLTYSGGPALQDAIALLQSSPLQWLTGWGKAGPEADIYRARLQNLNPISGLVPGTGAWNDMMNALNVWEKEDPDGFRDAVDKGTFTRSLMRLLSFPVYPPDQPDIMTPEGQAALRKQMDSIRQQFGKPDTTIPH